MPGPGRAFRWWGGAKGPRAGRVTQDAEALDASDRRVVRETREELLAAPATPDRGRLGCPIAILGLLLLVGWPRVADAVPGGSFVSPFVLLAGALMLIGGPVLALAGGARDRRAAESAVEAALRRLEDPDTDREIALRAATVLIVHAFTSQGPTTVQTFEPNEVAERVSLRLPLVVAVERELLADGSAHPMFTLEADDG